MPNPLNTEQIQSTADAFGPGGFSGMSGAAEPSDPARRYTSTKRSGGYVCSEPPMVMPLISDSAAASITASSVLPARSGPVSLTRSQLRTTWVDVTRLSPRLIAVAISCTVSP